MSGGFATKYFRIFDYEGTGIASPSAQSWETFYSSSNVMVSQCTSQLDFDAGCASDGTGYKVVFSAMPAGDGFTTVTIKAKSNGSILFGYTSFTLRRDASGTNPPSISNLPNRTLTLPSTGGAVYNTMFVIGDLDEGSPAMEDFQDISLTDFTEHSYNQTLLKDLGIDLTLLPSDEAYVTLEGPRDYSLTGTTEAAQTGVATVRVDVSDPEPTPNITSTLFVLQVSSSSNAAPSFTPSPDGFICLSSAYPEPYAAPISLCRRFQRPHAGWGT